MFTLSFAPFPLDYNPPDIVTSLNEDKPGSEGTGGSVTGWDTANADTRFYNSSNVSIKCQKPLSNVSLKGLIECLY